MFANHLNKETSLKDLKDLVATIFSIFLTKQLEGSEGSSDSVLPYSGRHTEPKKAP